MLWFIYFTKTVFRFKQKTLLKLKYLIYCYTGPNMQVQLSPFGKQKFPLRKKNEENIFLELSPLIGI